MYKLLNPYPDFGGGGDGADAAGAVAGAAS